jgi:archaellum component FlaF (FlaF/FlaG flagellin family)
MRKIAAILLIIFSLVQAGQLYSSLFTETTTVFMADEEKSPEKMETEKKADKKDYLSYNIMGLSFTRHTNTAFHNAENFKHPPCLEMQTPPPDFC